MIIWKGSPNFTRGRSGYRPEAVVIHIMAGTLAGTDAHFANPASQVSAHYGIGKQGQIHQYVKEEDTAFHAGTVDRPTWALIKPGINPNLYCVTPETRLLNSDLQWIRAGDVKIGDTLVGFDKTARLDQKHRHLQIAHITAKEEKKLPVYTLHLSDGTTLYSTAEHRWFIRRSRNHAPEWMQTDRIFASMKVRYRRYPVLFPRYFPVESLRENYSAGFLAAAYDGEGFIRYHQDGQLLLGFTQKKNAFLVSVQDKLQQYAFPYRRVELQKSRVQQVLFNGGRLHTYRFLMSFRPPRLLHNWRALLERGALPLTALSEVELEYIELAGTKDIAAISSSTQTYIAEGFGAHNTIGIEHEGQATDVWTESLKAASAAMVRDVCARWQIPIDRDHIIGHYQVRASKPNCPAVDKSIIDKIIFRAKPTMFLLIRKQGDEDVYFVVDGKRYHIGNGATLQLGRNRLWGDVIQELTPQQFNAMPKGGGLLFAYE